MPITKANVVFRAKFDAEAYKNQSLEEQATYLLNLKAVSKQIKALLDSVEPILYENLSLTRDSVLKTVSVMGEGGSIELPSGYKEKSLTQGETKAFENGLANLVSATELAKCVEKVPKIKKVAVNELRRIQGDNSAVAHFIDGVFCTTEPKDLVYHLNTEA